MKVTTENYYGQPANAEYFSASQVKSFNNCQAATLAEIRGEYSPEYSKALLVGSYVDAAFDGTLEQFTAKHPEIFNSRTGELKADYKSADDMIARAEQSPLFMEFLEGEKQKIFTGAIEGIPFKCRLDVFKPHERIVDLKTVADMEPKYHPEHGRMSPIEFWQWDLQMAIYQELAYQNIGEKLPCYLAIITKEKPSDIHLIQMPQDILDTNMDMLKHDLPKLDAIKQGLIEPERCGKCAYCRATHTLTEPSIFSMEE